MSFFAPSSATLLSAARYAVSMSLIEASKSVRMFAGSWVRIAQLACT